jgi:hypothetical protein
VKQHHGVLQARGTVVAGATIPASQHRAVDVVGGTAMTDSFIPYIVILDRGALSPAEDLEKAIIAAAQSQASGQVVARIERGTEVILEGEKLRNTIARHAHNR